MDKRSTLSNLRIPEPLRWAGIIWLGYTATNVALMAVGAL